jgi:hypothetical protein
MSADDDEEAKRKREEKRKKKRAEKRARMKAETERLAFTIPEFCQAHGISESMYYKIRHAGRGPREKRVLSKVIVTAEAAAEWRGDSKDAA